MTNGRKSNSVRPITLRHRPRPDGSPHVEELADQCEMDSGHTHLQIDGSQRGHLVSPEPSSTRMGDLLARNNLDEPVQVGNIRVVDCQLPETDLTVCDRLPKAELFVDRLGRPVCQGRRENVPAGRSKTVPLNATL